MVTVAASCPYPIGGTIMGYKKGNSIYTQQQSSLLFFTLCLLHATIRPFFYTLRNHKTLKFN